MHIVFVSAQHMTAQQKEEYKIQKGVGWWVNNGEV
jgi:hypothetical protein